MKALVAYFSASGVTAALANRLAKSIRGDVFEILPAKRYTAADLNWMDKNSRSTKEMKDPSSRPAIQNAADVSSYDVIFVGFPVWWYREPSIIDTFMESADFSGKTVVPFCTSGSSGPGDAAKIIATLVPQAKVESAKRFSSAASEAELFKWAAPYLEERR